MVVLWHCNVFWLWFQVLGSVSLSKSTDLVLRIGLRKGPVGLTEQYSAQVIYKSLIQRNHGILMIMLWAKQRGLREGKPSHENEDVVATRPKCKANSFLKSYGSGLESIHDELAGQKLCWPVTAMYLVRVDIKQWLTEDHQHKFWIVVETVIKSFSNDNSREIKRNLRWQFSLTKSVYWSYSGSDMTWLTVDTQNKVICSKLNCGDTWTHFSQWMEICEHKTKITNLWLI